MVMPMMSQLAGGACVILLDPLFIFALKLGVLGAAIATSLSQMIGLRTLQRTSRMTIKEKRRTDRCGRSLRTKC
jgi:Na+-driven multidrug efflux pump